MATIRSAGRRERGHYVAAHRKRGARDWVAHYGIACREPAVFAVDAVVPAQAGRAADREGVGVPCCRLLFQSIFTHGMALDAAALRRDLEAIGMHGDREALRDEAAARLARGWDH